MRSVSLVLALAVASAACGGKAQPSAEPEESDDIEDDPFVNRPGFKPTAFTVRVTGEGRPIIFIPGLGCPGEVWDDVVERLGDDVQAHVLTLAGFAGTKPIRPPLAAKTRKQLVRYIRSNGLDAPVVVGHSMGGYIGYWLAAENPDVVGALVVVDAGPAYFADDEQARRLRNTWAQAGDDELPRQVRVVYSMMTRHPKHVEPFIEQIARSDRQSIGDAIFELVKTDLTANTAAITAPVLLVLADGGLQHRYRKQAADIDNLEIVVIPKAKHFVMLDEPERFTSALENFIASLEE